MRTAGLLGRIDLLAQPGSVALARAYVRRLLASVGLVDVGDIELLVGEVVANSVKHSDSGRRRGGVVSLEVSDDGESVRVSVRDAGSARTIPQIPWQVDPLSESGRGLWMVRELSSAWGWSDDARGRVVWFKVTL
ncbi:ATP-binding protein [Sphaerisporangium sp. NPDC049003]|uniref:ATP-binding protein n=1 Tax=Sphaerisporangium sp. NPDC049003 TaxID=3364517 RepID=UPI003723C7D6